MVTHRLTPDTTLREPSLPILSVQDGVSGDPAMTGVPAKKHELLLQKLSEPPDTRGPLLEPTDRKPLATTLSHRIAGDLLRLLQPSFLAVAANTNLEAKERAAVLDMAAALGASPSLLDGATTVKVDSPKGALTLSRHPLLPWRIWLGKNAQGCGSSNLGVQGYVLEVSRSGYCWCVRGWETPGVVQAVEEILLCPGAEVRGATWA